MAAHINSNARRLRLSSATEAPGADEVRYKATVKLVRQRIHAANRILSAARDKANRELVEAGRLIFEREFRSDVAAYRGYGSQGGVFERLADDLERGPGTVRTWVEAAIVEDRVKKADFQAPENSLTMTHLLELARLDADPDAQLRVALECIDKRLPTRWLRTRVTMERNRLGLKRSRSRNRSAGGESGIRDHGGSRGPVATHEDIQAVYSAVCDELGQRGADDRVAAGKAILAAVRRRLAADKWLRDPGSSSVAALHRELARVFNRAPGPAQPFEAVIGPGPLVTIRREGWQRACELDVIMRKLRRIADVADEPNNQRVGSRRRKGTLADKQREVEAAIERAAEETWQ